MGNSDRAGLKRFVLWLPEAEHKTLKEMSDKTGVSMTQILRDGMKWRIKDISKLVPNNKTDSYRYGNR